jgi:hypothetical protein
MRCGQDNKEVLSASKKARHFFFIFFAISSSVLLTKRLRLWPIYIAAH